MIPNKNQKDKEKPERQRYFEEALSDFVHDAASGRAIRHLTDAGYTTAQIMQQLDYPTPRTRVEKTVYRYLMETGVLLGELPIPPEQMAQVVFGHASEQALFACLLQRLDQNGEDNSYISCPFGTMRTDAGLQKILSPLTAREKEYILGIPWEPKLMYHRLNRRMLEIGVQLAVNSNMFSFYFLKSRECIRVCA